MPENGFRLDFDGDVVIITGAGNALGKAHALAFAERGARVIVNNRQLPEEEGPSADQIVAEIRHLGGKALADYEDITVNNAAERIVHTALSAYGQMDVLVLNSALSPVGSLHKQEMVNFRTAMEDNFFSNVSLLQAALPVMEEQDYGLLPDHK